MNNTMTITTNLDDVLELNSDKKVIVFLDKFLSGWGCAKGVNHYQVILTDDDITTAAYKMRIHSADDKTIKNVRLSTLKDTTKLSSVSYLNGFAIADVGGLKNV